MGTRHVIIVKLDKKIKVAQYGQWDGYPTGQGVTIAKFLKSMNLDKFKDNLRKLRFVEDSKLDLLYKECENMPSDEFESKFPQYSRNTGAELLSLIQKGKVTELRDSSDFIKDTLFCEWAYKIDLDKGKVYLYRGTKRPYKTYKLKEFTVEAMKKLGY